MTRKMIACAAVLFLSLVAVAGFGQWVMAQDQNASVVWQQKMTQAGLSRASPARVAVYLRQNRLPFRQVSLPHYHCDQLIVTTDPTLTFDRLRGFSEQPRTLVLWFDHQKLFAWEVEPLMAPLKTKT